MCLGNCCDDVSNTLGESFTIGDEGKVADEAMSFIGGIGNPCPCAGPLLIEFHGDETECVTGHFGVEIFEWVEEEGNAQCYVKAFIVLWLSFCKLDPSGLRKLLIILCTDTVTRKEIVLDSWHTLVH